MDSTTSAQPGPARNVVVVGSGRSGTSLAAGLVATAGYHMGRRLLRANDANPRGFFEDYRTLLVNEQLLAPYTGELPQPRYTPAAPIYHRPLAERQRWLAVLWPEVAVREQPELLDKMRATMDGAPWCRKDPRFCHTLPAWEPVYRDAVRVCVFREPARTANSMVALARRQEVELSFEGALEVWAAAYLRVLRQHRHYGDWVFLHYEQLLDGSGIDRLERAVGVRVDRGAADQALSRAPDDGQWPAAIGDIYAELCDAAAFHPTKPEG